MGLRGIIFDFNGVLLWDTHLQEEAWRRFAQTLRETPFLPSEMRVHMHGRPNRYVLQYLVGRELSSLKIEELTARKELLYRELCLAQGEAFSLSPGAQELLEWLKAHGIPRAIATSSERVNVTFFVRHLGLEAWFRPEQIVYDDGSFPGKPAPDIYLRAASRLGLSPDSCMVVEDAPSGIAAAQAAGVGCVLALGPAEVHQHLRQIPGVAGVITSLADIPRLFLVDP